MRCSDFSDTVVQEAFSHRCFVVLRRFFLMVLCAAALGEAKAQRPFVCEDQFFQTLSDSVFAQLNEVVIDPSTNNVVFKSINARLPFPINAAGYRSTDNFIYCVNPRNNDLVRLDANGTPRVLANLPLNPNLAYLAGDISPDGRYLVMIGRGTLANGTSVSVDIARVDLESPTYATTLTRLDPTTAQILDIAFHPVTDVLYGYDSNFRRLVRIDLTNARVVTSFGTTPAPFIAGSLFFDAFGNLFAYGSPNSNSDQNTLYSIDPSTGQATPLTTGTPAASSDGCSCPYTIRLSKSVNPASAPTCFPVEYSFTLVNTSRRTVNDLHLLDDLPKDFVFVSVKSNPLGGILDSKAGDGSFSLRDIDLPAGKHEITIVVRTGNVPTGVYKNQARLLGLPESLGQTRVSDNLATLVADDSTALTVLRPAFDTLRPRTAICNGAASLSLDARPFASQAGLPVTYLWPDGSQAPTFNVSAGGNYPVKLIAGCDTALVIFDVLASNIDVALVRDTFTIPLGDSIFLEANVRNTGVQTLLQWTDPFAGSVRTPTRASTWAVPTNDGQYTILASNEWGCRDSVTASVRVLKDFRVYFPNVFKPESDSENAFFFGSGPASAMLKTLAVFSRWGDKMFERRDLPLNTPAVGWDGTRDGREALPGVYVWMAELIFLDGTTATVAGDVTLLR